MVATRSPTYGVLATSLREAILRGEFARGVRLPTEAELAAAHAVSRQTVRRAMQDLVAEGLVFRVPGRGTYAVEESDRYLRHFGSVEDLMSLSVDTECEIVLPLATRRDRVAAARLELAGTEVVSVAFVRRRSPLRPPRPRRRRGSAASRRRRCSASTASTARTPTRPSNSRSAISTRRSSPTGCGCDAARSDPADRRGGAVRATR